MLVLEAPEGFELRVYFLVGLGKFLCHSVEVLLQALCSGHGCIELGREYLNGFFGGSQLAREHLQLRIDTCNEFLWR